MQLKMYAYVNDTGYEITFENVPVPRAGELIELRNERAPYHGEYRVREVAHIYEEDVFQYVFVRLDKTSTDIDA